MEHISSLSPYQLNSSASGRFYRDLSLFHDVIIRRSKGETEWIIRSFLDFRIEAMASADTSFGEALVQFLSIGIFMRRYGHRAVHSSRGSVVLLQGLYRTRRNCKSLKPAVDALRGVLAYYLLHAFGNQTPRWNRSDFKALVRWLEATGEFPEESKKLREWSEFFSSIAPERVIVILATAGKLAELFSREGKNYLGDYTEGVEARRQELEKERKFKEDYLFCTRSEEEYFLNMFGAEVLNRVLAEGFGKTRKKVLLLPTCMASPNMGKCQSAWNGPALKCRACSSECQVNILQREMLGKGVDTCLIPHSSGFSKYLSNWKDQTETGLIGVACVLNLLTGGYEMQKLNIPSQCVFLDFAGCRKHWHPVGVPTRIDSGQLRRVIESRSKCTGSCCNLSHGNQNEGMTVDFGMETEKIEMFNNV